MDVLDKLNCLMQDRGWTAYKLSKESGLSESTLANIFKRGTVPSITTLENICNTFQITLSQFFSEADMVELTPELKELFDSWITLTPEQKSAVKQLLQVMNHCK